MKIKGINNQGIVSIIIVLAVGLFAFGAAVVMASNAVNGLNKNMNTTSGDQVFYTAESATEEGIYQFIQSMASLYGDQNFDTINNVSESGFTIIKDWPYAQVVGSSTGTGVHRDVSMRVALFPGAGAFDHAVYANHTLDISGGANMEIWGDVFANDAINCGGNPNIHGVAASPGSISPSCNTDESVEGDSVEVIPPPQIEPDEYFDAAVLDGHYYASSTPAQSFLNNASTTAYVFSNDPGLTKIHNATLYGFLYITGDLQLTGNDSTISAADGYAAIVVDGDLSITGTPIINGIVYVRGATSFSGGNKTINGSLISAGGLDTTALSGSVTINYVSSGEIEGFEATSTDSLQISSSSWSEE